MGVVAGAALLYAILNFHLIHARDGVHMVPKVDAQLGGTYVDIREFGPREWLERPEIFMALRRANRDDLIELAADDAVRHGLDRLLGPSKNDR
jgi:hypothetical protein